MTRDEIADAWERALRAAEYEIDHAYSRERLERYFFLMRCALLQAGSARVHSLGATAVLSLNGFKPWDERDLAAWAERDLPEASRAHADPPGGDGDLLRWIERSGYPERLRPIILHRVYDLFGKEVARTLGLHLTPRYLKGELDMPVNGKSEKPWWENVESGGWVKLTPGKHRLTIMGDPVRAINNFGRETLQFPTNAGTLETSSGAILRVLADAAKRKKGRIAGLTLSLIVTGEGKDKRYSQVEVK